MVIFDEVILICLVGRFFWTRCRSHRTHKRFARLPCEILVKNDINVSQGSVATHLRCGEIYIDRYCKFTVELPVNEFWKPINNWCSWQRLGGLIAETTPQPPYSKFTCCFHLRTSPYFVRPTECLTFKGNLRTDVFITHCYGHFWRSLSGSKLTILLFVIISAVCWKLVRWIKPRPIDSYILRVTADCSAVWSLGL